MNGLPGGMNGRLLPLTMKTPDAIILQKRKGASHMMNIRQYSLFALTCPEHPAA
jgi:hypothetical protein